MLYCFYLFLNIFKIIHFDIYFGKSRVMSVKVMNISPKITNKFHFSSKKAENRLLTNFAKVSCSIFLQPAASCVRFT